MALQDIYKLELTVALFNQGCASFQRAAHASGENSAEAETALISAARDIPDSLEWALKIYLQHFPKLPSEARRKLRHPNFNDLINLMKMYGDPPLDVKTSQQMYGYRDMRNEATHKGAIPPVNEVRNAIEGVSQFLRTYLSVSEAQLNQTETPKSELDLNALREKINRLFDDVALQAFCHDHFPEVYDKFGTGTRKDEKMTLLLDYCRRDPGRYQRLLDALEKQTPTVVPVSSLGSNKTSVSAATPSQHGRLEQKKQELEENLNLLSNLISDLEQDLVLEDRSDNQKRLQATIDRKKQLQIKYEDELATIEKQLE